MSWGILLWTFWWIFHVSGYIIFSPEMTLPLLHTRGKKKRISRCSPNCGWAISPAEIACTPGGFLVRNRLMWRGVELQSTCKSLAVLSSLFYQAAGGASRPETELGSWFPVNSEQRLRVFSSDVVHELSATQTQLSFSAAKCAQCALNT